MMGAVSPSESTEKTPSYAWTILAVLCVVSVASSLNQFKVPPVLPVLIRDFNLSLGNSGMLMSAFSVTGLLLALPAGFILQRLGPRFTGLIAVGAVSFGSVLGTFSTSVPVMLTSRFIEGAGLGLITVVAPATIALWFPEARRGTPLGIWTTCMPFGGILTLNLAPRLASLGGWQLVWKVGALFSLAALILFWLLFRMPRDTGDKQPGRREDSMLSGYGRAMLNRSLWLIALQFICFNAVCLALGTYFPTFLNTVRGHPLSTAAFISSLSTIMALFSQPFGGWLSDRLGVRRRLVVASSLLLAPISVALFLATGWLVPALMATFGLVAGITVPAIFAAVPEVMGSPRLAGPGMAVLALGQNLGMFIGPILFGMLADSAGWTGAGYMLAPVCVLAAAAAWMARFR